MNSDGTFEAGWLELRQRVDRAARDNGLAECLAQWCRARATPSVMVADLGAGTGANADFLAQHLPGPQRWLLVDHDRHLLAGADAALSRRCSPDGQRLVTEAWVRDLASIMNTLPHCVAVVTASALLDLVSDQWVRHVADGCAARTTAALFALNYDGTVTWTPPVDGDHAVRDAVNIHQRRDKGFGPALGPTAALETAAAFRRRGFHVRICRSDWTVEADAVHLQTALVEGWYAAASQQCPEQRERFVQWTRHRRYWIGRGESTVRVGHRCVLALPP